VPLDDCADDIGDDLLVQCLTADGKWTSATISAQGLNENETHMYFYVRQHGICGIFEK
jgi:hypothetical protein